MTSEPPLAVAIVIGSTREGRVGPTVARWIADRARGRPDLAVTVVDLAEAGLPAVFPSGPDPAVAALRERLAAADAFVVVTPEYNHSFPASLKQAIDVTTSAWTAKPVAFVSYGGISGGLRAVEHLRGVFAEVHATTVRDTVSFAGAGACFGAGGEPLDAAATDAAATVLLDRLAWWGDALRTARDRHAYAR